MFSVGDVLPVLVGKGNKPQIWIQAISDLEHKSFVQVVESSIPLFPFVRVTTESGAVLVSVGNQVIMSVRPELEDEVNIFQLDLRPIGLNIVGDKNSLKAGGAEFSGSTFAGAGTFMGFSL